MLSRGESQANCLHELPPDRTKRGIAIRSIRKTLHVGSEYPILFGPHDACGSKSSS